MQKVTSIVGVVVLSGLLLPQVGAADALKPDPEGYIRARIMLAPVAPRDEVACAELIVKENSNQQTRKE